MKSIFQLLIVCFVLFGFISLSIAFDKEDNLLKPISEKLVDDYYIRQISDNEYMIFKYIKTVDISKVDELIETNDLLIKDIEKEKCPDDKHYFQCEQEKEYEIRTLEYEKIEAIKELAILE